MSETSSQRSDAKMLEKRHRSATVSFGSVLFVAVTCVGTRLQPKEGRGRSHQGPRLACRQAYIVHDTNVGRGVTRGGSYSPALPDDPPSHLPSPCAPCVLLGLTRNSRQGPRRRGRR